MAKTYKGGYKIISLARLSLVAGAEALTIKGIHHSIEASYGKPLLVEDIVVDGVEKNDVWVKELKVVDGAFVIELYGLKLTITDEDEVTAEEIEVVIKSITTAEDEMDVAIEDGDEILLSTTNEDSTDFNLPEECHLIITGGLNDETLITYVSSFGLGGENYPYVRLIAGKEVYIKRVGNVILLSAVGFEL